MSAETPRAKLLRVWSAVARRVFREARLSPDDADEFLRDGLAEMTDAQCADMARVPEDLLAKVRIRRPSRVPGCWSSP